MTNNYTLFLAYVQMGIHTHVNLLMVFVVQNRPIFAHVFLGGWGFTQPRGIRGFLVVKSV